ncbi:hypothetical protein C0Q70_16357 [Pomacea canaliculata]|uniref:Uncharacterized protein n=1 Tax=Pomacea canaliculata TaxID=400727 RepID=A0A2T7NPJ7_POMCA|nr:hypothetical protein C0Q70_16357 [Pomacea canaliculata]
MFVLAHAHKRLVLTNVTYVRVRSCMCTCMFVLSEVNVSCTRPRTYSVALADVVTVRSPVHGMVSLPDGGHLSAGQRFRMPAQRTLRHCAPSQRHHCKSG